MTPEIRCPSCSLPSDCCPHLLVLLGPEPGQVIGGPLARRMSRMWQLIVEGVGEDAGGVLFESWESLRHQVAAEADRMIEEGGGAGIFVADPACMEAVVEACIAAEEL